MDNNVPSRPGQNFGGQRNPQRNAPSAETQTPASSPIPVIAARNPLDRSRPSNSGHQNSPFRTYSPPPTPTADAGERNAPQYSQSFPATESPRTSNHDSDSRPMVNRPAHTERPTPTHDYPPAAPQNPVANIPQRIQEQPHHQVPQRENNSHNNEARQEISRAPQPEPQHVARDNSSDSSAHSRQNSGGQDQSDRSQNHSRR
jgi:hypothetical protein